MNDCLFCKITRKEIPSNVIYENDKIFAFLDINPTGKGHTLVVPKKHCVNIHDMEETELNPLMQAVKKLAGEIKKALKADGINIAMNNEAASGQVIMHAHFHIIPRYNNDGLKPWPNHKATPEELISVQKTITNSF